LSWRATTTRLTKTTRAQGLSHVMTPQRTQRAVDALVDANVVQVVRSSGCFVRVGALGELVEALRDRCRAEGREYASAFAERHWEKVNAEVLAKEREAEACEATSERRERGSVGKRAREEEAGTRGVGGEKRAREDGEDAETGSREEEEEKAREDATARGGAVQPMPPTTTTTTSRTMVPRTRTMPPPPMSLTERLTPFRRAPPPTTPRPSPKSRTKPTPPTQPSIEDGNPTSFRALGATILRGVHTIIHERDETLRRDMRTLVDAINASHREIAALRLQIDDLVDARQRRAVARVSSPMDDSPNAERPDDVDERAVVDDARLAERVVSPCFEALVVAANRARAPTRSTPSISPAPLERSNETMKIRT